MTFERNNKYLLLIILIPVILRALTPFLLKNASLQLPEFTFLNIISNYFYWASFILFFIMAISWQFVLKHVPLSYAYPFTGLSYIFILFIGYLYFNESISFYNIIGATLIIIGTIVFAKNKNNE